MDQNYKSTSEYRKLSKTMLLFLVPWGTLLLLFFIRFFDHAFQWDTRLLFIIFLLSSGYILIYYLHKLRLCKEAFSESLLLHTYGVSLGNIQTDAPVNRFFLCLIRGVLIFMASYGTIAGLATAFELPFSGLAVTTGMLLTSMLAAFLYYNKITFYFGYFILFASFTITAFAFYPYINSGFQAFINTVYQKYGDFFFLNSVRESNELIADRYITISVTMIFSGLMMAILLNIIISARMNLMETFFITFLPLQIALYIDRLPAIPYLAMLLSVYITVGILGRSRHYRMSLNMKREPFFSKKIVKKSKNHSLCYYSYQSSSRGILTLSLYSICFCMLFLALCLSLFFGGLHSKGLSNQLKNTTDAYVKTFVQSGIWGFFDRYPATGGLSRGQLGGAGSVNPDYQTDLTVTFVPYSSDTVYLKGYTGVHYNNNIFAPDYNLPDSIPMSGSLSEGSFARMEISFVDPESNIAAAVYPYDTLHSSLVPETGDLIQPFFMEEPENDLPAMESETYTEAFRLWDDTMADYNTGSLQDSADEQHYEVLYVPFINSTFYAPNPAITEEYETMVYDNYLEVPEHLEETIENFCREAGLTELLDRETKAASYEERQSLRLGIAGRLKSYFVRNFPYTMSPGATPRNRDVIEYFLTEQRRGFCAHFASSAALILRRMGIPTRYIEGYCIQLSDLSEAQLVPGNISEWYIGENSLPETGPVTVEVTDASAHAWIEIYLDGYGWIPYEMTPPAFGDTMNAGSLMSVLSGLFTPVQRIADSSGASGDTSGLTPPSFSFFSSVDFIASPLFILLGVLSFIILLAALRQPIKLKFRLYCALHDKNYAQAVLISYCGFVKKLKKTKRISQKYPLIRDIETFLLRSTKETPDGLSVHDWIRLAETAAFSKKTITRTQYNQFRHFIRTFRNGNTR